MVNLHVYIYASALTYWTSLKINLRRRLRWNSPDPPQKERRGSEVAGRYCIIMVRARPVPLHSVWAVLQSTLFPSFYLKGEKGSADLHQLTW